jgi:hypothetical protein
MAVVSLTGQDTVTFNNRIITDLADGDCVTLEFPNDIANLKTGKNGNAIYAINETGKQCEVKLRIVRDSPDDVFFAGLLTQQQLNFPGTVLLIGEFVKISGDGAGNLSNDTYILSGGIFTKQVNAKSNVEGDTAQSVAEYTLRFSNAPRAIT